jgi:hypothetical protein
MACGTSTAFRKLVQFYRLLFKKDLRREQSSIERCYEIRSRRRRRNDERTFTYLGDARTASPYLQPQSILQAHQRRGCLPGAFAIQTTKLPLPTFNRKSLTCGTFK